MYVSNRVDSGLNVVVLKSMLPYHILIGKWNLLTSGEVFSKM